MKKFVLLGSLALASVLFAAEPSGENTADNATSDSANQPQVIAMASTNEPQLEITQADINIQNELSDASDATMEENKTVDTFFDEFKDEFGIEFGETVEGRTYFAGKADVLVQESDADFAKALQNAYSRAMLNLQSNFIYEAFGRMVTEKITKDSADDSTNAKEFEELPKGGTLAQIGDKIANLAGAKLDSLLTEYGINPEGLVEERKKTLLQQNMINKELARAVGKMKGLVAVQTHLAKNKHGQYQIGVVAVMSDKTRQIATDMALSRPSLIKKASGKKVSEFLPKETAGFVNEFGTRLVYDENGEPMIMSYGNWGYRPAQGNARMTSRLEDTAKKQAQSIADAAIIEFVNINVSLVNENITGEQYEEITKQTTNLLSGDVNQADETIANVISKFSSTVKATSSGKLRGIRTAKTWDYTAENGVEHVGVVRYYSFKNYQNTTNAIKGNSAKPAAVTTQQPASKTINRTSKRVNDIDDF